MKTFKIHATFKQPESQKETIIKKRSQLSPHFKLSELNRAKSEKNFLKNFRKRSGVLIRLLKEQAKTENSLKNRAETLEKFEKIRTKNDFFSARCGLKKEFSSTGRLFERQAIPTNDYEFSRQVSKKLSVKKIPASISSCRLDPNLIPDSTKKPITLEELDFYLKTKCKSLSRYFIS
jgi:hypothetical protein